MELNENRRKEFDHLVHSQDKVKGTFNIRTSASIQAKKKEKPRKHGNSDSLLLVPYMIEDIESTNSFYLSHQDEEIL